MLVDLSRAGGYTNTSEGGMSFYLVVRALPHPQHRQDCIAGCIVWPHQETVLKPRALEREQLVDAALLIGSTGLSLWSEEKEAYFAVTLDDLTPEGKRLYHTLKRLYGKVEIVSLLDT